MAAPGPRIRKILDIKRIIMQPALTSHYEVYIKPPPAAESTINQNIFPGEMTDILTLSCSDASLPGSTLTTHELNNDYTGVTQRHAYRRIYDDRADFTFYVNQSYDQIRYFEAWLRYIVGEQVGGAEDIHNFYRVRYPQYYKSPFISITKFERNYGTREGSKTMKYNFINAFPVSINSMPVSYESSQLLKVTVGFSFDRYIASNIKENAGVSEPGKTTSKTTPTSPFDLTQADQAKINTNAFQQGLNLGNFSPGTLTNTNFTNFSDSSLSNPFSGNNNTLNTRLF
jgi:hypothetical protein